MINFTNNGLIVDFKADDPNNQNVAGVKYRWDFGDGAIFTSDLNSINHKYTSPGVYSVKLTVTNPEGLSDEDSVEIDLSSRNYTINLPINVVGTYLFVDEVGGLQENGQFLKDIKSSPTTLDLNQLYIDLGLAPGDMIVITSVGLHIPGPGWGNVAKGALAVFIDKNGNFLYPGSDGQFSPVITAPTYPVGIPTDIPQDFYLGFDQPSTIQIPIGAQKIAFSADDSFFSDNIDPDHDYGVTIKITVIKNTDTPLN